MSDYISKSALLDFLKEETKQDRPDDFKIKNIQRYIEDIPTIDETEIIRKAMERIIEKLEEQYGVNQYEGDTLVAYEQAYIHIDEAIEIVKEEGGLNEN